jgi:hypothetical protein
MNILLFPPIAFIIIFIFVYILFKLITPAPTYGAIGTHKAPQAGGRITPPDDYQNFFSYATFFTILHVAGLILATWAFNPLAETIGPVIAYLISIIIILAVLFI